MKFYVIAGEASGDLHASNLIKALKQQSPTANFRAWGGDLMQQAGATIVKHYRDLAFMGFWEVLMNLRTILGNLSFCKKDILAYHPDALILIDYPGFNLRIAKWAKEQGIKVYYYISPQIWAWKEKRIHAIKRDVDEMFVILPFEKDFYEDKHQFPVHFVGHPLLDVINDYQAPNDFRTLHSLTTQPIVALLPGSRQQEVSNMLQTMLQIVPQFPQCQFVLACATSLEDSFYQQIIQAHNIADQITLVKDETYALLSHADAALVASGTATLETALFEVPQVVCYKGNYITYRIAKALIKIPYISLVNLIAEKELVKEIIQNDFTPELVGKELAKVLQNETQQKLKKEYQLLKEKLGKQGASQKTAQLILKDFPL